MKRLLSYFHLLIFTLLVASCGDFYDFDTSEPVPAREMKLPRKVINLVEGDQYYIPVTFNPSQVTTEAVWWLPANEDVARFVNDTLVGVTQGQTVVYVTSVTDRLQDSCLVNVLPPMYVNPKGYLYDMVIYAQVTVHGRPYTVADQDSLIVCAYCDDELRGIGVMRQWRDMPYMELRVWSPFEYGDLIDMRCYYRGKALVELFPNMLTFDGETHGTLSNLYSMVLDEDAEEYNFGFEFGPEEIFDEGEEQEIVPGDAED
ncbi:MAG: hypothetical protein IKQ05_04755 [Prevotella sp.]|jgi:hypothetical protein|nr:hypothetical protein [Prevotella sp.]